MKTKKEIKEEIARIEEEEKSLGHEKKTFFSPINWGKIRALEWVLDDE